MRSLLIAVLFGLIGGVAVGLQGPLASLISQRLGVLESAFLVHLGGTLLALLLLLPFKGGRLGAWHTLPWYALAAGTLGVLVLGSVSYTMPRIGATAGVMLLIAGQLVISLIFDHFGLLNTAVRPIDLGRLAGLLFLAIGVWLIVRR
ncbi:MAG: DMT family transporter [Anaerolineales bacterium]